MITFKEENINTTATGETRQHLADVIKSQVKYLNNVAQAFANRENDEDSHEQWDEIECDLLEIEPQIEMSFSAYRERGEFDNITLCLGLGGPNVYLSLDNGTLKVCWGGSVATYNTGLSYETEWVGYIWDYMEQSFK